MYTSHTHASAWELVGSPMLALAIDICPKIVIMHSEGEMNI